MAGHTRMGAAVVSAVLLLTVGCGGNEPTGGAPTPIDPGAGGETSETPSASASTPTDKPTTPASTATTPAGPARQIIVVTHIFKNQPVVQAFASAYPVYFKALVDRDDAVLRSTFPSYFHADVEAQIAVAKRAGWVMRPPGSIVLRKVDKLPDGKFRIGSCRSQRTEYFDPVAKKWVRSAPKGTPDVIVMAPLNGTFVMYRWLGSRNAGFTCAGIPYPA
ncbi:hypothetical protein [Kribbella deserti]|uniref:Uncharacterized protein n=1 Tax=Kribbella deserti TaxID=1926257 RepID=A0ABV6QNM3_9ACTN